MTYKRKYYQIKNGFRSGLEEKFSDWAKENGLDLQYEIEKVQYVIPASLHNYTPDFKLSDGSYIETKGRFTTEDRNKHILIKTQHPEIKVRFIFSNPNTKLDKRRPTTYGDWCKKWGFDYLGWKDVEQGQWFEDIPLQNTEE